MFRKLLLIIAVFTLLGTMTVSAKTVPTQIVFQVENTITGDEPADAETFTYLLIPQGIDCPMPKNNIVTIDNSGKVNFSEIIFENTGIYKYQLTQVSGENENYTYDDTIYNITVYVVTNNDSVLYTMITAFENNSTEKSDELIFENIYNKGEEAVKPDIDDGDDTETPQTGDTDNSLFPVILIAVSLVVIILLLFLKKKKSSK